MADVWQQAEDLLRDVESRITSPPDRTYVTNGTPAFDCEQLVLHVSLIQRGTTGQTRSTRREGPTVVTGTFTRLWCVPTGDRALPSLQQMIDSGQEITRGGFELWQAVIAAVDDHTCHPAADEGVSVGPEGGFAGWQATVRWSP